jgi:hypothetical protein
LEINPLGLWGSPLILEVTGSIYGSNEVSIFFYPNLLSEGLLTQFLFKTNRETTDDIKITFYYIYTTLLDRQTGHILTFV